MKEQEKTKNYYDGIAPGYKELYHEEQIKKINLILPHLPTLTPNSITLDLGSGDGVLNKFIKDSKLISLDLSFELLKLNSNKEKLQACTTKLPIKSNSIDLIIAFTVIQDVGDTKIAIKEMNRILKEKGTLIISFLKNSTKKENILNNLNNYFKIGKQFEEEKDLILIYKK